MNRSTLLLQSSSLVLLALCANAQETEFEPEPVPPQMKDVKTPEPPTPWTEPLPEEPSTPEMDAPLPPKSSARTVGRGLLAGLDRYQVYIDEPGDGRIWAVGDSYKASFGPEGATYVPFLGTAAPQNFPVCFTLRSVRAGAEVIGFDAVAAPQRYGNRIVFERGIVDEVYDLTPTSIEQSFVLERPLAGEIAIELGVESELARASDDDGLVLASDFGGVRYGRAFALDAYAGRTEIAAGWEGDAIRIVVPAERVAAAAWPLVVDPLISTINLDNEVSEDGAPDVAYDASTGLWMVVYERVFSTADHDVYYRHFGASGAWFAAGYIDSTAVHWANPKVASNNFFDQFLCVAETGIATGGARTIRGRLRSSGTSIGTQFTISGGFSGDHHNPDVGGDPMPTGSTHFCVVWERDLSASNHDIMAQIVNGDGTMPTVAIFLSNSSGTYDAWPAIANSCGVGTPRYWHVAWQRSVSSSNNDLWGAQIRSDGVVSLPFAIDESSANTIYPAVSTTTDDLSRTYLVAAMRRNAGGSSDFNTWGWALSGTTLLDTGNLTSMSGASTSDAQWSPSVDCDGSLFVVADNEAPTGSIDHDVFASTFHMLNGQLTLAEGHQVLASSSTSESLADVACAASSGGPPRRTMIVWQNLTSDGIGDIEAGVYDANPFAQYCDPGYDGVMPCSCGNGPSAANRGCNNSANTGGAALVATGQVSPDTVTFFASGMLSSALCIFAQGSALVGSGTAFGDGVRCVGGTQLRLATKTAVLGAAQYPGGSDPSITERAAELGAPITAGSSRFYYVYYRDPGAYACAATFNATNAIHVQW